MRTNILTLVGFVTIMFLLAGCGGGTSNNEYLGKLPGIAKKYAEKIDKKKKDLKECTDMQKSFKLHKELELLGDEADKSIAEYMASNPVPKVPFEKRGTVRRSVEVFLGAGGVNV